MRKVIFGILFPLAIFATTIWWRATWKADIHPMQLVWVIWVAAVYIDGLLMGIGLQAYWFGGGHRQDSSAARSKRKAASDD